MGSIPSDGTILLTDVRVLSLTILALLGLSLTGLAEETGEVATVQAAPAIVTSFREGLALLKQADAEKITDERAPLYREALKLFDGVLEEKPDVYAAQANAAYCVNQLASLATEPTKRAALVQEARRRYETAAKSPSAEPRMFGAWAALVISESSNAGEVARRRELLTESIHIARTGMQRAHSKAERARLAYHFGRAELFLAQVTAERAGRRALYESALEHFKTAAEVDSVAKQPQLYASWGIVVLELARLRNDRMLMRQAIERLQTALEMDATSLTVRYNLVCAYALLGQTENAMRHLQFCLDNDDTNRTYFNAARQDPDLDALRSTPEFNAIFGAAPPNRLLSPFEKPVFSDK